MGAGRLSGVLHGVCSSCPVPVVGRTSLWRDVRTTGVPVKDYISQSADVHDLRLRAAAISRWTSGATAVARLAVALCCWRSCSSPTSSSSRPAAPRWSCFRSCSCCSACMRFGWKGAVGLARGAVLVGGDGVAGRRRICGSAWSTCSSEVPPVPQRRAIDTGRRAAGVLEEVGRLHRGGAADRPRHRLDPAISSGKQRPGRPGDGRGRGRQSAQSDLRGCDPARAGRSGCALGDVDRASPAVSRPRACGLGRARRGRRRTSSARCSTPICSTSPTAGSTWSASALPAGSVLAKRRRRRPRRRSRRAELARLRSAPRRGVARRPKGRYGMRHDADGEAMIRLPRLTSRQWLIVLHDLMATAAAIVATFYHPVRGRAAFELPRRPAGAGCRPSSLYAGVVYFVFGLYEAKWRFASLPDLINIFRASTVLALSLLVLDYILVSPNFYGTFFFGKITIVLYWFLQMVFLGRAAHRLSLFPRRAHAPAREADEFGADADPRPRRRRRGAAARDRKRRGQEDLAGRHPVAVARRSGPVDPRRSRARRISRSLEQRGQGAGRRGHHGCAPGADAVGAWRRRPSPKRS